MLDGIKTFLVMRFAPIVNHAPIVKTSTVENGMCTFQNFNIVINF